MLIATISGCGGGGGTGAPAPEEEAAPPPEDNLTVNSAPTIGGLPDTNVTARERYSFMPTSSDSDGDPLSFSIDNAPQWMSFSANNGAISGTPQLADVGVYNGIRISVSDGQESASLSFTLVVSTPADNSPPQISGTPGIEVIATDSYQFIPTAADADGDALTFSVASLPAWASFSPATGELSGTPTEADVGFYAGVSVSVTDGISTVSLPTFGVEVLAAGRFGVTLSWTPPTENTDDTVLTDLTAYRIYQGTAPGNYSEITNVDNPGLSSFGIDRLARGEYYFAITAVNGRGVESRLSNEVRISIPTD